MAADATLVSAFLVGLLGSTHCLGMCGGIVGALTLGLKTGYPPLAGAIVSVSAGVQRWPHRDLRHRRRRRRLRKRADSAHRATGTGAPDREAGFRRLHAAARLFISPAGGRRSRRWRKSAASCGCESSPSAGNFCR